MSFEDAARRSAPTPRREHAALLKEVFSRARVRIRLSSKERLRPLFPSYGSQTRESKISDLPTVFLDAVTKSIGKSGEPPISTVTGRASSPGEFDERIKFQTGQIAQLDPNRPVVWERVRRGQDRIVSGRGADVEAPGSRVRLVELERTPAQNDTVFSLHHIFPFY
jgi:hypothetical protein